MRIIIFTLLLGLSFITAHPNNLSLLIGKKQEQAQSIKAIEFLKKNQELRKYYECRFTGEFQSLPEDLRIELEHAFPKYKFLIARMEVYIDLPPKKHDLTLVTNAETGAVVGFVWFFSWTMPSSSFERILLGEKVEAKDEVLKKIKSLAKLIVYTGDGQVGRTIIRKNKIIVEMRRGKEVFRTIEVKIDKSLQLGPLIIRRQDGRKIG